MLSVFDKGGFAPCPSPFNLAAHVLATGGKTPDKIALCVLNLSTAERWSYARLTSAVRGTATGLLQAGLRPGDIVVLRLGNTVDFPVAYLGGIAAGIVPVPTSAQLTEPEVAKIIRDLSPAAILQAPGIACPETEIPRISEQTYRAWRDLPAAEYAMGDPDRLAYIVYTSGTSGTPRAVAHAHRAIWARQMMMQGWYDLRPSDRLLHAGAFNWTFTLGTGLLDPWTCGATALIPEAGITPAQLPLLLRRNDATLFAAAPGVFRQILKTSPGPLPKLRHALSAGEKLPQRLRAAWEAETGTAICEAFGMSECSTFISAPPQQTVSPGSLGRPQTGRHLAVLDAMGVPVSRGTPGTLAVHRSDPGLMLGYHAAPEATGARFSGDWFLTGDVVRMGDDDQIYYEGRNDDMMNAGGFRVSPLEVEQALMTVPGVKEVAVVDLEIKADTRVIAAFYVSDAPLDDAVWQSHADAQLARYKQPRLYRRLDALPRTPNGKLNRKALRDHR